MVYRISAKLRTVSYSYLFLRLCGADFAFQCRSIPKHVVAMPLLFIADHSPCAAGLS